ncbi:MAG TPA: N,N-dimethylformamidase beta subunit family domain-containing protein [Chloroflexota bacterium]|nr:N,N-dimethylformamidase beta subunit family domain-containing protein [Chloroflexota bacterium]
MTDTKGPRNSVTGRGWPERVIVAIVLTAVALVSNASWAKPLPSPSLNGAVPAIAIAAARVHTGVRTPVQAALQKPETRDQKLRSGLDRPRLPSSLNPIQVENALTGTTAWMLSDPASQDQISGYPSRESARPSQTISFSVRSTESRFSAAIYRIGWYGGAGGRLMATFPSLLGHAWPIPAPDSSTGLLICHWPASFSVTIPADWVSGIYLVKLTDLAGRQAYIPFTVVESQPQSPLLLVDAVATSEAYNWWGSRSLYINTHFHGASAQLAHRAVMVSFHRPFAQNDGAGWFLSWEIHTVRWIEKNGYDISYADDLDVNDDPSILLHRKGVIIAGHDEYWSLAMRNAMDAAVASGVSLANLAANTGYWQIRLAPEGSDPDGIEICYKDFNRDPIHRTKPTLATVLWRSPQVHRPESQLLGAMYEDYLGHYGPFPWVVKDPSNWVLEGTGIKAGAKVSGIVGPEEDAVLGGYPHPGGLHALSASPVLTSSRQHRVSNSTVYQATSGAYVFNGGTFDWGYGLDTVRQSFWYYRPARSSPSPEIERITANVLDRFLQGRGGS